MKKLIFTVALIAYALFGTCQKEGDKVTYQDSTYTVHVGPKGGKYIWLKSGEKHYLSEGTKTGQRPVILSNGKAEYKGKQYDVQIGPKGGQYIIVDGKKIYIPRLA